MIRVRLGVRVRKHLSEVAPHLPVVGVTNERRLVFELPRPEAAAREFCAQEHCVAGYSTPNVRDEGRLEAGEARWKTSLPLRG